MQILRPKYPIFSEVRFSGWMIPIFRQERAIILKIGTKKILASVTRMCHSIDINTGKRKSCESLSKNEIGVCEIMTADKIVLSPSIRLIHLAVLFLLTARPI